MAKKPIEEKDESLSMVEMIEESAEIETLQNNKSVAALVVGVMKEIGPIGKDNTTTDKKYNYRGIDDALNNLQPALVKLGLIIIPSTVKVECRQHTKNNVPVGYITQVTKEFLGISAHTGDQLSLGRFAGEAYDGLDKGLAKAESVAYRTMVWQVFCVPTQDEELDPEHPSNDAQLKGNVAGTQPQPPKQQKAQPPMQPPAIPLMEQKHWNAVIAKLNKLEIPENGHHSAMIIRLRDLGITPPTVLQNLPFAQGKMLSVQLDEEIEAKNAFLGGE